MADRGKDKDTKPVFDADLSKDEELDEESADSAELEGDEVETGAEGDEFESEEEQEEDESEDGAAAPGKSARSAEKVGAFHFSLRRGGKAEEEVGKRHVGSVKESHERVHIDDRPSAIYALVCAGGLIGILVLSVVGGALPKGSGPSLPPLVVPTGKPTPTACVTASPIATATPLATATSSAPATATPKPTPTLDPSAAAVASASASSKAQVAAAQESANASAQASAVASFCAIPVATPTPTATPAATASK